MSYVRWTFEERDQTEERLAQLLQETAGDCLRRAVRTHFAEASQVLPEDRRRWAFNNVDVEHALSSRHFAPKITKRDKYIEGLEAKHGCSLEEYIRRLESNQRPPEFIPYIKHLSEKPLPLKPEPVDEREFVIAGVFEKHYEEIHRAFPGLRIRWIRPNEKVAQIKQKVLQKIAVVDLHGLVDGEVLRAIHGFSRECHKGNGLNFVKASLTHLAAA